MRKVVPILIFVLSAGFGLHAQIVNDWLGELNVQGIKFEIVLHVTEKDAGLETRMDIPVQSLTGLMADVTTYAEDTFEAKWNIAGIAIKGHIDSNGNLAAEFNQGKYIQPVDFIPVKNSEDLPKTTRQQDPKPPFDYRIKAVTFTNQKEKISLAGTLTLPGDIKNPPVVILISGSGQQNRDEEIFGHKPFWVIADDFARKGIGVLRYDDRGIGGSEAGPALSQATSRNFANDAEAALDYLLSQGYTNIGMAGHSEGGMIAPMVASERKEVKFVILMAGPGIPCDSLLALQTYHSSVAAGAPEATAAYNKGFTMRLAQYIKTYEGDHLETALKNKIAIMLDEDVMTRDLSQGNKDQIIENTIGTMSAPWMQYFLKYEPEPYLKKLKCPVLAINGSLDIQVASMENLAGIGDALKKGKCKNYKIHEFKGLNHLFQPAKTGSVSEYGKIPVTIAPEVMDMMSGWILENTGK